MSAFFSDKTRLFLPEVPHSADERYESVGIGKPLSVEILHLAFGNVRDWWGKSEILVSSWAKTGGTAKPAPRVINLMRKNISEFDHLSDLGAAEYGHQLVFHTPAYKGEILRFSLEFLEIDKLKPDEIESLGNGLKSLSRLAIFAPQLAYLSLAPEVLELGEKLYNTINRNDLVLLEHLDLSLNIPDSKVLTSGRFVLVNGNHSSNLVEKFKLDFDNKLKTNDGILAENAGMKDAYIVICINAAEREEYKEFEYDSETQQILQAFLNQGLTQNIADILSDSVKAAIQFDSVKEVLKLKKDQDREDDNAKKQKIGKDIETELKRLAVDQAALLKEVLSL